MTWQWAVIVCVAIICFSGLVGYGVYLSWLERMAENMKKTDEQIQRVIMNMGDTRMGDGPTQSMGRPN